MIGKSIREIVTRSDVGVKRHFDLGIIKDLSSQSSIRNIREYEFTKGRRKV